MLPDFVLDFPLSHQDRFAGLLPLVMCREVPSQQDDIHRLLFLDEVEKRVQELRWSVAVFAAVNFGLGAGVLGKPIFGVAANGIVAVDG